MTLKNVSVSKSFSLSTSLSRFDKKFDKNNLGKNVISKQAEKIIINAELDTSELDKIYILVEGGHVKKINPDSISIEITECEPAKKDNDFVNEGVYVGQMNYYEGTLSISLKAPKSIVLSLSKGLLAKKF